MADSFIIAADAVSVNNAAPETGIPEIPFLQERVKGKELPSRRALEDLCELVKTVRHAHRPDHVNVVFIVMSQRLLAFLQLHRKVSCTPREACPIQRYDGST